MALFISKKDICNITFDSLDNRQTIVKINYYKLSRCR
jgi:hypothetical protein